MRFSARQRLRRQADFEAVRAQGRRMECGGFAVYARVRPPEEGPREARLGVVASRHTGKATVRNRAKRLFREIFRLHMHDLPPYCDLVVIVRRRFQNYTFNQLEERYQKAAGQIFRAGRT